MSIDERLQEIKDIYQSIGKYFHSDVKWMHDTIKQQQEEIEKQKALKIETYRANEGWQQRVAELEKERREITAAHEAFLREVEYSVNLEIIYNKHFYELIHLAEQVRMAKLSADANDPYINLNGELEGEGVDGE